MINIRKFDYITLGLIHEELKNEGLPTLQRVTLYRMEKRWKFPQWDRPKGEWRRYTRSEADEIKSIVKEKLRTEDRPPIERFVARFIDVFKP